MINRAEVSVLRLIFSGRNSLDHFVDSLKLDCADARAIAEGLCKNGHLKAKGKYLTNSLTYELTESGEKVITTRLSKSDKESLRYGLLSDELKVLESVTKEGVNRNDLENNLSEIGAGEIHSILVNLKEKNLIKFSGFVRIKAGLTNEGEILINKAQEGTG